MNKTKRIFALIGAILLIALYGSTLVFALIGEPHTMAALKASVVATVIIPVLIWVYTFIYKLVKKESDDLYRKANSKDDDNIEAES